MQVYQALGGLLAKAVGWLFSPLPVLFFPYPLLRPSSALTGEAQMWSWRSLPAKTKALTLSARRLFCLQGLVTMGVGQ